MACLAPAAAVNAGVSCPNGQKYVLFMVIISYHDGVLERKCRVSPLIVKPSEDKERLQSKWVHVLIL
jgi:hypothetical protein